jgi:hypothetical protein
MARIEVNLDTQVSNFVAVAKGTYPMTITAVKDRRADGKQDLEIRLEHVTPAVELTGLDGQPLKGQPSGLFMYLQLATDKQWKLRQVVEAAGLTWGALDTDDLLQKTVNVVVDIEEYNGEMKNRATRCTKAA